MPIKGQASETPSKKSDHVNQKLLKNVNTKILYHKTDILSRKSFISKIQIILDID